MVLKIVQLMFSYIFNKLQKYINIENTYRFVTPLSIDSIEALFEFELEAARFICDSIFKRVLSI